MSKATEAIEDRLKKSVESNSLWWILVARSALDAEFAI